MQYFLKRISSIVILIIIIISGCNFDTSLLDLAMDDNNYVGPVIEKTSSSTVVYNPTLVQNPTQAATSTQLDSQTSTLIPTSIKSPTSTPQPTITPTYAILNGAVNVGALSCNYGPGAMYLFKYGVFEGDYLEIFGRNRSGTWLLIRAIGGTNACWVKSDYMDINGEVMSIAPVKIHSVLPRTYMPGFYQMSGVTAIRNENVVNLSWNVLQMIARDDFDLTNQAPYVIEAWVCQGGEIVEILKGAWYEYSSVIDEPGCETQSYVRVLGAEKHGYTDWFNFVWPLHQPTETPQP